MTDAVAAPRRSFLPVLLGGLVTTGLALIGVYALSSGPDGIYIMGLYVSYVIPYGALFVGLVAASGYGIAAWFGGYRISGSTLWLVAGVQFAAYLAAQYVEYRQIGAGLPFMTYFDLATRNFAFESDSGGMGRSLGMWGYGIRLLEVIGFVGGSVVVPMLLQGRPFCVSCGRYMRTKTLGLLPASAPQRRVEPEDVEGRAALEAEQGAAMERGLATQATLLQSASEATAPERTAEALRALRTAHPGADKLPARIQVKLTRCPACSTGHLKTVLVTGQGSEIEWKDLASVPVPAALVRMV